MQETLSKKNKIQFGLLLFVAVMVISFTFYFYQVFFSANILVDTPEQQIIIDKGTNFNKLLENLYEERIVKDRVSFAFVSKIMKYQEKVRPGIYELKSNMTNVQVVRLLRGGMQKPVMVTLNNVRTPDDLILKVSEQLMMSRDELSKAYYEMAGSNSYGLDSLNFLCLFLPNTYEVYWTITPVAFLKKMQKEYEAYWSQNRINKADEMGLSAVEVSILASIVQAETNLIEEKPIMAGVYLNRLKRNMKLQADPTVVYAVGDFEIKRVLTKHKEIDSPYNTYMYAGLPPGPINLPEMKSLEAVLNAQEHNYLYFCAKEDFSGAHNFASNLRDHLVNARKYQQALNKRKIY